MSRRLLVLLGCALFVAGCFKLDGVLESSGSGTMTISYAVGEDTTVATVRKVFEGPDVKVEDVTVANKRATVKMKFADVSKIRSSQVFKDVTVGWGKDEQGNGAFVARYLSSKPQQPDDKILEKIGREATVELVFPGEVLETNAASKSGNKATWKVPTKDFVGTAGVTMKASFKLAAAQGGAPAPPAAGAPAAPAEKKP